MDVASARQHDLRLACIHEHAHAAVAGHFGIVGRVTIFENPDGSLDGEKFFGGNFQLYAGGDAHQHRMIGLAGTVAENVDRDPGIEAWEIQEYLDLHVIELSATDAELAGDYAEGDVEECLALVRQWWSGIAQEAKFEAAKWEEVASS